MVDVQKLILQEKRPFLDAQKCFVSSDLRVALPAHEGAPVRLTDGRRSLVCRLYVRPELRPGTALADGCATCLVPAGAEPPPAGPPARLSVPEALSVTRLSVRLVCSSAADVLRLRRRDAAVTAARALLTGRALSARCRLGCAGTPLGRRLGVLWLEVTCPQLAGETLGSAAADADVTVAAVETRLHAGFAAERPPTSGHATARARLTAAARHFCHPDSDRSSSVLLLGPAGCGKATLARAAAAAAGALPVTLRCDDLPSERPGAAQTELRARAAEARRLADCGPLLLLLRAVHAVRGEPRAQLLQLLDEVRRWPRTLVVATCSQPQQLHSALRSAARFDTELHLTVGGAEDRVEHLTHHLAGRSLVDCSMQQLADMTPGYSVADLRALCREAVFGRTQQDAELRLADFSRALLVIRPSALKSGPGAAPLPPLSWDRLAGVGSLRARLRRCLVTPLRRPDAHRRLGVPAPRGLLLHGPPGCAKTSLVRAAASECRAAFLTASPAELFSPYVGDSERAITELFQRARMTAPAVIFLDELDAIVGTRSASGQSGVQAKLLSALLNEMDGIGIKQDQAAVDSAVFVVGATNRRDLIDEALLRPGRLDQHVHVPLPDRQAREEIIQLYLTGMPVCNDVSAAELADMTEGFSGAELRHLCNEAGLAALTEDIGASAATRRHFLRHLGAEPDGNGTGPAGPLAKGAGQR
ncbi:spermatogenesis-associated protein 5-like protein 1 [Amphibalanus amphitrite]|uniref:spermatogenesis-associated protein 5-like protein 1 n=1 Tax=Amphibalanus amphitrite TaxID=1232801 RepID=UPI001C9037CF|nr:spermatogenesis-associated protein 5-like protein 1 [Amphibalanus amphitrite]